MPLPVTDTRHLFRPLCAEIVALLRRLPPDAWERRIMAGTWRVRDVVAHLLDTALRRLSFDRDGREPTAPAHPPASDAELAAFIRDLNAEWIRIAERFSPRLLTDLYHQASTDLADFMERQELDAPARFPVSWAGETQSSAWLDIGREFTEIWHHGAQVRDAVGAGCFPDARWLHAVLRIALHALPHAYRGVHAAPGRSLAIEIIGPAGGTWSLRRQSNGWDVEEGDAGDAAARARLADEVAWRLFFNALSAAEAETVIHLEGDPALGRPLLGARAVIV